MKLRAVLTSEDSPVARRLQSIVPHQKNIIQ